MIRASLATAAFAMLALSGVGALLLLSNLLLRPENLTTLSLPVIAVVAGTASTFSPCGLPAIPGFLTFIGGREVRTAPQRARLAFAASLGAGSVVLVFGVVVALVGEGASGWVASHVRWVQLSVGIALVALAVAHLLDRTGGLPLIGRLTAAGGAVWERSAGRPTIAGSYLFGLGYVAVGAG